MKKYFTLFFLTIKEYFTYRLSFMLWRFRVFLNLLILFFLWNAVFDKNIQFAHYSKSQLLSYILIANILSNFVLGTRTTDIASDINDGKIINQLLKPVSFFKYHLTRDLADKSINTFFFFFELALIIFFFHPPLLLPKNILLAAVFFLNGVMISYFINLMLSFIGFWTTEVWVARFLFLMLLFFVTGSYFPLDLLPGPLYLLLLTTPFPYLFYLPAKILLINGTLGQWNNLPFYLMFFFSFFWLFATWILAKQIFIKGTKNFSFWGR